jgi:hypothetical protein
VLVCTTKQLGIKKERRVEREQPYAHKKDDELKKNQRRKKRRD